MTWICIASGPSLHAQDLDVARASGFPTVAVNNSWRAAPWCHYIYAGDEFWWRHYGPSVDIDAERWTCSQSASTRYGVNLHRARGGYNSGLRAIQFAASKGAERILLLGYDCQATGGRLHHHEDHPGPKNPKDRTFEIWLKQFRELARSLKGGPSVINCSRETALDCFPRSTIEEAIREPVGA